MNEVRANVLSPYATDSERSEVRATVKSVRAEWRERLSLSTKLSPNSKLKKKADVLLLDMRILDDLVGEAGSEENLVFIICAQVASGVPLGGWCAHYMVQRGLVWALLSEREEWLQRYYRAQEGMADEYVSEIVPIADAATIEDHKVAGLQINARKSTAEFYHPTRFGTAKAAREQTVGMVIDAGLAFAASELLARIARPVVTERVVATQEQPSENWL